MSTPAHKLDEAERLLAELEAVERKLHRLEEGLTRSHRLATLGTMASIIAHEFNNILTPVISYCQLARQSPEDGPMLRKAVDKALHGAQRAAEISASMLGFARDSEGQAQCRIAEAVREVFNCLGRPPQRDGIRLELRIDPEATAAIPPVNLQQVLLNLVLNARQAMHRRGGELVISAERAGSRVRVEVADTGPGIPADLLPHVFDPFVTRRQRGGDGEVHGTGLGLAICRELVQRAGGAIRIGRSGPGGTAFHIDLPAAGGPRQPPPARGQARPHGGGGGDDAPAGTADGRALLGG